MIPRIFTSATSFGALAIILVSAAFAISTPIQADGDILEPSAVDQKALGHAFTVYTGPPVRFEKNAIAWNLRAGKDYLLRTINEEYGGVHKYYWVASDSFEPRLYSTYSATALYTLLKYQRKFGKDEVILGASNKIIQFILSMQNMDKKSKAFGAFHYSFAIDTQLKDNKFVVGTNSKTIYALLELYALTSDRHYLETAIRSANWLLTMQAVNGKMQSYQRLAKNGKWRNSKKFSLLYNSEALSAFSRMYSHTQDRRYLLAANKIATILKNEQRTQGCYMGDDYRPPNTISSSWFLMSLLDIYRATGEESYWRPISRCSDNLIGKLIDEPDNESNHGRWTGTSYSSGNAWSDEVLTEINLYCQNRRKTDCEKYVEAPMKNFHWLDTLTYSERNPQLTLNPKRANGGIIRNRSANRLEVRTDSVAHAMNAYINFFDRLK